MVVFKVNNKRAYRGLKRVDIREYIKESKVVLTIMRIKLVLCLIGYCH